MRVSYTQTRHIEATHSRRQLSIASVLDAHICPRRAVLEASDNRSCEPVRLIPLPLNILPLPSLIPPQDLLELFQELQIDQKKISCLLEEAPSIDHALGEEIDEFEEFSV